MKKMTPNQKKKKLKKTININKPTKQMISKQGHLNSHNDHVQVYTDSFCVSI